MTAPKGPPSEAFKLGELDVSPARNVVLRAGETFHLEPKAMDVLCALARRPGEVVSRDTLIDEIWGVEFGADESLTRAIWQLRKTLKETGAGGEYIETVPKRGYRLTVPVSSAEIDGGSADQPAAPAPNAGTNGAKPPLWRRRGSAIVAAGLITVIAAGAVLWLAGSNLTPSARDAAETVITVTAPDRSVAVLPFENMSSNDDDKYFADGLTEQVINDLTKISALQVAPRTSSFYYGRKDSDVREKAAALGVRHVLEGGVQRSGARLRVTAQLVDAEDGFHLWSETYDRTLEDIFAIQDDIAEQVAAALRAEILGEEQTVLAAQISDTAEIENIYLTGQARYRAHGLEDLIEAERLFSEVLKRQPDHAAAAAGYVLTLREQYFRYAHRPWNAYLSKSRPVLETALEANPNSSALRAAYAQFLADEAAGGAEVKRPGRILALMTAYQVDPDSLAEAEAQARAALDIDPNSVEALETLANIKLMRRQSPIEDVLELYQKAIAIDPLARNAWMGLGDAYFVFGRIDKARESYERLAELYPHFAPAHHVLGFLELSTPGQEGRVDLALARHLRARPYGDSLMGYWYESWGWFLMGEREKAVNVIDQYEGPKYPSLIRDIIKYSQLGEYSKLADTYIEWLDFTDDALSGIFIAGALAQEGRYEELRGVIDAYFPGLLDASPPRVDWNNVRVLPYAAAYLREQGDPQGADQLCERGMTFLEGQSETAQAIHWSLRFLCYANMQKNADAVDELKAAIDRGFHNYVVSTSPVVPVPLYDFAFLGPLLEDPRFIAQIDRMRANNAAAYERFKARENADLRERN